jgi:hypothetical protein
VKAAESTWAHEKKSFQCEFWADFELIS